MEPQLHAPLLQLTRKYIFQLFIYYQCSYLHSSLESEPLGLEASNRYQVNRLDFASPDGLLPIVPFFPLRGYRALQNTIKLVNGIR